MLKNYLIYLGVILLAIFWVWFFNKYIDWRIKRWRLKQKKKKGK